MVNKRGLRTLLKYMIIFVIAFTMNFESKQVCAGYSDSIYSVNAQGNGYVAGIITEVPSIDTNGCCTVRIGNQLYDTTDEFNYNKAAKIHAEDNSCQVIGVLVSGKIDETYAADEILEPCVEISTDPSEVIYQNGKYSATKIKLTIRISSTPIEIFRTGRDPIPDNILDFLNIRLKHIEITSSDSSGIRFGPTGLLGWGDNIEKIEQDIDVTLNRNSEYFFSKNYTYNIVIDPEKIPEKANLKVIFDCRIKTNTIETTNKASITIGNLDKQKIDANKSSLGNLRGSAGKNIRDNAVSHCALDSSLKNYLSKDEYEICQRYVYAYSANLIAALDNEECTKNEKVRKKIIEKLGINSEILTEYNELCGTSEIAFESNKQYRVAVTVNLGTYNFTTGKTHSAMGMVTTVLYKDGKKISSGTGTVTYINMDELVANLKDIANMSIKSVWSGVFRPIDNLASSIAEGTIVEAMKEEGIIGTFSDELFKVLTKPTELYLEVQVHCPVDIEVVDIDGNICASVIDNEIIGSTGEVYVRVEGDEKYIYLIDNNYQIRLTGTANGTMDYVIRERDMDGSILRIISYMNVELTTGEAYYADLPSAAERLSKQYDLINEKGNVISASSDTREGETSNHLISWAIIGSDNDTLYITGQGYMENYDSFDTPPWYIEDEEFNINKQIKKVIIDDRISNIGSHAFQIDSVTEVELPENVNYIGEFAFASARELSDINFPNTILRIGNAAFSDTSLESIVLPENIISVGDSLFSGCDKVKKIKFNTPLLESIGESCFQNCSSLEVVELSEKIKYIYDFAFYGCSNIKVIQIPESVKYLGTNMFSGCCNLVLEYK